MPEIKLGDANALRITLNSFMKELGDGVDEAFKEAIDEVGKEGAKRIQQNSPVSKNSGGRLGHYKRGWKYEYKQSKRRYIRAVIYNRSKPGLAHLLEHGHQIVDRNQKDHGKTKAQSHINEVNEWVASETPKRIAQKMNQLKLGGK